MFFEFLGIYMERNTINSIKNYIDIDFTTKFNIYNRIYPDIKIIYCGSPQTSKASNTFQWAWLGT
jgi:hypothetical protein